jgi:hypothetical protein
MIEMIFPKWSIKTTYLKYYCIVQRPASVARTAARVHLDAVVMRCIYLIYQDYTPNIKFEDSQLLFPRLLTKE